MSFIYSDCHRGSGDICTWINCQHHCTLTTRWQLRYTKNVVVHILSGWRPKFVRISFAVMWFKDLEYQGYIYHYENGSAWIFKIMDSSRTGKQMKHLQKIKSSLSTATWKWASTIMIVALVAQDNCLTFAKSVSVSLAYSISLHLKALSNFGILQCSVTQTEFAMCTDKQKFDSTANQKKMF